MVGHKSPVLEYETSRSYNRQVFLLNHSYAFYAYHQIHENFIRLGVVLSKGRDEKGKSRVSLIPFVLLMQRQAMSAFLSLCSHQSFEAWVLLRPCLESILVIGKWVDDPKNAEIWKNRDQDPQAYKKAYTGSKLRSVSLPRSIEIQKVLSKINDDFMHANPRYYQRHTVITPGETDAVYLKLEYFDDDADHLTHVFAMLHLLIVMQDSLAELLGSQLRDQPKVNVGLGEFSRELGLRYTAFVDKHPDRAHALRELGLWPLQTLRDADR